MFASLSSAIPQVKAGKLKAFAVTGAQRSPSVPDLPTMSEAALPGFVAAAWYGIVGPAGIPPPVVGTLSKARFRARDKGSAGPSVRFRRRSPAGNARRVRAPDQIRNGQVGEGREGVRREG